MITTISYFINNRLWPTDSVRPDGWRVTVTGEVQYDTVTEIISFWMTPRHSPRTRLFLAKISMKWQLVLHTGLTGPWEMYELLRRRWWLLRTILDQTRLDLVQKKSLKKRSIFTSQTRQIDDSRIEVMIPSYLLMSSKSCQIDKLWIFISLKSIAVAGRDQPVNFSQSTLQIDWYIHSMTTRIFPIVARKYVGRPK